MTKRYKDDMGDDKFQVTFLLGDRSGDGHGHSHHQQITSNFSKQEIELAYQAGVTIVGFDLTKHCAKYEDSTLPFTAVMSLKDHGFDVENNLDGDHALQ